MPVTEYLSFLAHCDECAWEDVYLYEESAEMAMEDHMRECHGERI